MLLSNLDMECFDVIELAKDEISKINHNKNDCICDLLIFFSTKSFPQQSNLNYMNTYIHYT